MEAGGLEREVSQVMLSTCPAFTADGPRMATLAGASGERQVSKVGIKVGSVC